MKTNTLYQAIGLNDKKEYIEAKNAFLAKKKAKKILGNVKLVVPANAVLDYEEEDDDGEE